MIKEIFIFAFLLVCCSCLPAAPLQKVMAVVVQPEAGKAPAIAAENPEIFATAESGWRNRGYGGGWGHGGYGHGGRWGGGGWGHGGRGGYGGYGGYGGGWKRG